MGGLTTSGAPPPALAAQSQSQSQSQSRSVSGQSATNETVVIAPDDSDCLDEPNESQSDAGAAPLAWPVSGGEQPGEQSYLASLTRSHSQASTDAGAVPLPSAPLIEVAPRLYFAVFQEPLPHPNTLNAGAGTAAAVFPAEPPVSAGDHIRRYWQQLHPEGLQYHPDLVQGWAPSQPLPQQFHWVTTDLPYTEDDQAIPYQYGAFWDDWGPLNMSMVYLFCNHMEQLMQDPVLRDHGIVLYTSVSPTIKTNTAALAALRSVLALGQSPCDAFSPFATMDFQPWRDAGYGRADFCLTLQDVLYGAWRAKQNRLFDLSSFDMEEYFYSEHPSNGDWNWITPSFIAFASPIDPLYVKRLRQGQDVVYTTDDERKRLEWDRRKKRLVNDFARRKVQLVVRLNNTLYDKSVFQDAGMDHADMYFDDGSNPKPEIIKEFIDRADRIVEAGGVVAVHCKAGLGRTGVLIGAYLVWKYGFGPTEAIGWMRVQRPGCVVGPQQQFLYENAHEWVKWGEQARATKQAQAILARERSQVNQTIAELKAQLAEARSASAANAAARTTTPISRKRKSDEHVLLPSFAGSGAVPGAGDENSDPSAQRPAKAQVFQHVGSSDVFAGQLRSAQLVSTPGVGGRPNTPLEAPTTVSRIKPTPCVGQPRKSPSPAHKRHFHHLLAAGLSPRRGSNESSNSGSASASGSGSGSGSASTSASGSGSGSGPGPGPASALGASSALVLGASLDARMSETASRSRTPSNPLAHSLGAHSPPTSALGAGPGPGPGPGPGANPSPERRTKPSLLLAMGGGAGSGSSSDESDAVMTPTHLRGSHAGSRAGDDVNNTPTRVNYSPSSALARNGSTSPAAAALSPGKQEPNMVNVTASSPAAKLATGFTLSSPVRRPHTPTRAQNVAPAGVLGDNKTLNIVRTQQTTPTSGTVVGEDVFGPKASTGLSLSSGPTTPTRTGIARASPTVKALYGLKDASSRAPPSHPPPALGAGSIPLRSPVRTRSRTMASSRAEQTSSSAASVGGLFRPTVSSRSARTTAQAVGSTTTTAVVPNNGTGTSTTKPNLAINCSPVARASTRATSRPGTRSGSVRRTTSRSASGSSNGSAGSTVGARTRARHAAANAAKDASSAAGFGRGRGPLTNRAARSNHPPSALNI